MKDFLNNYMKDSTKAFDYARGERLFRKTFEQLSQAFPKGIARPSKGRWGTTPLNLYEGVAVGAAFAVQKAGKLHKDGADKWLGDESLRANTIGATNNPAAVKGRIEFCRDKFLGK